MPEDLTNFDVSSLDALAKLEADELVLRGLLEKATWRRDKEVEVYSRVMTDYAARMATIVEQAGLVRQRVRDDLQKLDAVHDQYRAALDQAKVQLQECEFRHEIGEFAPDEFQRCQQTAQRAISEREAEFESARKLRLRYVELLPADAAPPAPAPPVVVAPVVAAAPAPRPVAMPTAPIPRPAPAPAAAMSDTVDVHGEAPTGAEGATVFRRPPAPSDFQVPPRGTMAAESEPFGTIALSAAMLVEDRGGLPGTHHRLGPVTTIGRTSENQIVVPVKEVSRKHAEVLMEDGGFVVRDHSPNGTFVNGERIVEHRLRDGDKLRIGGKVFVFKA